MNNGIVGQKASLILATMIVALTGKNALACCLGNCPRFDTQCSHLECDQILRKIPRFVTLR